jgi:cytoskeleton protein RodZ
LNKFFNQIANMQSLGQYLKEQREFRNFTLGQVSQFTKVKEPFLKAIEENRFDILPPATYVKGFLNVYARHLGVDPNEVLLQYQNYLASLTPAEPIEMRQEITPLKRWVRPWFFFAGMFSQKWAHPLKGTWFAHMHW